ncbi:MAG: hypothetical protein BGN88_04860 [Clostridiales bacterium 43-6]|nr:MAG: hypothetical protein BGN88_04860 [Clostridiales bacterium 43-6]
MHNDLNFFAVNKANNKSSAKGMTIIMPILIFLLLVSGAYGWIAFQKYDYQQKIKAIDTELKQDKYQRMLETMGNQVAIRDYYTKYVTGLQAASKNYNQILKKDGIFFTYIYKNIPPNVVITHLNVTEQKVTMSCSTNDIMTPVTLTQALRKQMKVKTDPTAEDEPVFQYTNYTGLTAIMKDNVITGYTFEITCDIKQQVVKEEKK